MLPNSINNALNPFWKPKTPSLSLNPTNRTKPTTPARTARRPVTQVAPVRPAVVAPQAVARPTGYDSLAQAIASRVRVPVRQFTLEDVFSAREQDLARRNIASRVARVLDPQAAEGRTNISEGFAGRGLFRSGLRSRQLDEFDADIAERRQTQQEELYNIRFQEALEELRRRQEEAEREAALLNLDNINFRQFI